MTNLMADCSSSLSTRWTLMFHRLSSRRNGISKIFQVSGVPTDEGKRTQASCADRMKRSSFSVVVSLTLAHIRYGRYWLPYLNSAPSNSIQFIELSIGLFKGWVSRRSQPRDDGRVRDLSLLLVGSETETFT